MKSDNPLVQLVFDAQAILESHDAPLGPSKPDTIKSLNAKLRTPLVNDLLAHADAHTEKKVAQARAAFIAPLERVQGKFQQLRKGYMGTMLMSIDRDLADVDAALKLAREGAK